MENAIGKQQQIHKLSHCIVPHAHTYTQCTLGRAMAIETHSQLTQCAHTKDRMNEVPRSALRLICHSSAMPEYSDAPKLELLGHVSYRIDATNFYSILRRRLLFHLLV